MTSLNVIRIDRNSGLFVCDEGRYWNQEWMILYTPDKIRTLLDPDLSERTGIYVYIGSTGASSFGDEIMQTLREELSDAIRVSLETNGTVPEELSTIEQIAWYAVASIQKMLRRHVDDFLIGRFNLTTRQILEGKTQSGDRESELSNEDILKEAFPFVTLKNTPAELKGLLNNAQLLAGYDPQSGFRIFQIEERDFGIEEVAELFLSEGSGKIACDLTLSAFMASHSKSERMNGFDRVDALAALLEGVEEAHQLVAGVGGYPKIISIDASQSDPARRVIEISDHRSRLATEIVAAAAHGIVDWDMGRDMLERLIFLGEGFHTINQEFLTCLKDKRLLRFLRGYPLSDHGVEDMREEKGGVA